MYKNTIIKKQIIIRIRNPVTRTAVLVAIAEAAKKMLKQSSKKITCRKNIFEMNSFNIKNDTIPPFK